VERLAPSSTLLTGDGGALEREKKNNHRDRNLLRTWINFPQDLGLDITQL